jgi:DNA ligase-1
LEIGLCEKFLEVTDSQKVLPPGIWYVEPKYDGLRGIFVVNSVGQISVFSRNGKEIYNVDHIINELKVLGKAVYNRVFDGELYGEAWNDSISIAHTQSIHANSENLKFHVFDTLAIEEWQSQVAVQPYIERKSQARELLGNLQAIKVAPETRVTQYDQAILIYTALLEQGYEGIVFKEGNAAYPFGRSKNWLKLKPVETFDLRILRADQGTGKNKNRLGAFICDFEGVEVRVGGGFTDELRQQLWEGKEGCIGRVIEVEASPGKTKDGSLRWPIFMKFRNDKDS